MKQKKTYAVRLFEYMRAHPEEVEKIAKEIMKSRSKVFEELAKH